MDPFDCRPAKGRTPVGQQFDPNLQGGLLIDRELTPSLDELVGDLHLPHSDTMSYNSL